MSATVAAPENMPDELAAYLQTDAEIYFRLDKVCLEKRNLQATIDQECIDMILRTEPPTREFVSGPGTLEDF